MKVLQSLISDPTIWILMCVAALIFMKVFLGYNYFNVTQIVLRHLESFKNDKGKINKVLFGIAFIVPMIFALAIARIRLIDDSAINILTVIISILTSMFFTLLAVIMDIKSHRDNSGKKENSSQATIMACLIKSVYYAIMFEILISIFLLILCFAAVFTGKYSFVQSFVLYWLSAMLILNLFMVLKRIFILIDETLK